MATDLEGGGVRAEVVKDRGGRAATRVVGWNRMALCHYCRKREAGRAVAGGKIFCSPGCVVAWIDSLPPAHPAFEEAAGRERVAGRVEEEIARLARKARPREG